MKKSLFSVLVLFWSFSAFPQAERERPQADGGRSVMERERSQADGERSLTDSLVSKLDYYSVRRAPAILFAHFDKTLYTNNENVWFTVYRLNNRHPVRNNIVSIILVGDANRSIALEDKFFMSDEIGFGHVILPDSIPSGDYSFIVYTNNLQKGLAPDVFIQRVSVRNLSADAGKKAPGAGGIRGGMAAEDPGPVVRFYPEGGRLPDRLASRVGWETRNRSGRPLQRTGILYEDGRVIDTVRTDNYGMGQFQLMADSRSRYTLRLLSAGGVDSAVYTLPGAVADKPSVFLPEALANDTLRLLVRSRVPGSFSLVVHNYRDLFLVFPVKADSNGKVLRLVLSGLPRGIAGLMLLDSLQRPCAERLFFAHYDRRDLLNIVTDRQEYKKREKVSLKLSINYPDGKPGAGLVSVAVVQAARLPLNRRKNIEDYVYIDHELAAVPFKGAYLGPARRDSVARSRGMLPEDRACLENILLIKGWRNYAWPELQRATAADTLIEYDSLPFTGLVRGPGKRSPGSVSIMVMRDSSMNMVSSDPAGNFMLDEADLVTAARKSPRLMVSGNDPTRYQILVRDPYEEINRALSAHYFPPPVSQLMAEQKDEWEDIRELKRVKTLQEVVVTARKNNSFYGTGKWENECGDYVCRYGFLNCPMHGGDSDNKPPVRGTSYKIYDGASGGGVEMYHMTVYQGCIPRRTDNGSVAVNGIHYAQEFYPEDYSQETGQAEFLSTLFWKHLYTIRPDGNSPLQFFTGDITGTFKVIVQGVTGEDVIYGESQFTVRE